MVVNDECDISVISVVFLIISCFLIGFYVHDCVNNENGSQEYCNNMFIAMIVFCVLELIFLVLTGHYLISSCKK